MLGISIGPGIFNFLLSAAVIGFLAFVIFAKQAKLFDIALWVAAGVAVLAALWRLINVIQLSSLSGIGLYLCLLASLGAAGTFGTIAVQRLMRKG